MSENKCVFCGKPAAYKVNRAYFDMADLKVKTHEIPLCEDCKVSEDLNEILGKIRDTKTVELSFERARYYFNIKLALAIRAALDAETDYYKIEILYPGYIGEIFFDRNTLQPMMAGVKFAREYEKN